MMENMGVNVTESRASGMQNRSKGINDTVCLNSKKTIIE
jgi:hypothetical protein